MPHEEQTWGEKTLFSYKLVPKACSAVPIIAHFLLSASSIFNLYLLPYQRPLFILSPSA